MTHHLWMDALLGALGLTLFELIALRPWFGKGDKLQRFVGGFTPRLTVVDLEAITRPAGGQAAQLVQRAELLAAGGSMRRAAW